MGGGGRCAETWPCQIIISDPSSADGDYQPHDIATLLKEYFRDLPNSLLTSEMYAVCSAIGVRKYISLSI